MVQKIEGYMVFFIIDNKQQTEYFTYVGKTSISIKDF